MPRSDCAPSHPDGILERAHSSAEFINVDKVLVARFLKRDEIAKLKAAAICVNVGYAIANDGVALYVRIYNSFCIADGGYLVIELNAPLRVFD